MAEQQDQHNERLQQDNQGNEGDFTPDKKAPAAEPKATSTIKRSVWTEVHDQTIEQLREKSKERLSNLPGNSPEKQGE